MNYQQIYPTDPLRKHVRYFWMLEDDSLEFSDKTFKIMSDGLPGLIFQENKKAFLDKGNKKLPQLFLYGQTTRYTEHKSIQPFRKISTLTQGMFVGSVSDNFDERIEQKIFHAEIVVDNEKVSAETKAYKKIPQILSFTDEDGNDNMKQVIEANYR